MQLTTERPSKRLVQYYLTKWNSLENYKLQESSLNLLFNQLSPKNDTIESILLKVSTLNDFYSTNIFDTYTVAKHILKLNIDNDLNNSSKKIVNKIALVSMKNRNINFYSFATKYCSHHKPEVYPICDYYVERILIDSKKHHNFSIFKKKDLKDYTIFVQIVKEFQSFYNLQEFSIREVDLFLWQYGKEKFPKKY